MFTACEKDDTYTIELEAMSDGVITNSSPRVINGYFNGLQGKELRIGWDNNGYAMRAFVTFNISSILPPSDKSLTINSAILKIYESNTNLHPFDANDSERVVKADLLEYFTLNTNDYDVNGIMNCGIIANSGYNVLEEHTLDVKNAIWNYYSQDPANNHQVQFRLRFSDDSNVTDPDNSELDGSTWNIFAEEEENYYTPILEISYTHSKD